LVYQVYQVYPYIYQIYQNTKFTGEVYKSRLNATNILERIEISNK
jgi:hypothetical protein